MPFSSSDLTTLKLRKESLDHCLNSLNLNEKLKKNVQGILSTIQISTCSLSFFPDEGINSKMKAAITALTEMKKNLTSKDQKKIDQLITHLERPTEEIIDEEVLHDWHCLYYESD